MNRSAVDAYVFGLKLCVEALNKHERGNELDRIAQAEERIAASSAVATTERKRALIAANLGLRVFGPSALRSAGLESLAEKLGACPEIINAETAEIARNLAREIEQSEEHAAAFAAYKIGAVLRSVADAAKAARYAMDPAAAIRERYSHADAPSGAAAAHATDAYRGAYAYAPPAERERLVERAFAGLDALIAAGAN